MPHNVFQPEDLESATCLRGADVIVSEDTEGSFGTLSESLCKVSIANNSFLGFSASIRGAALRTPSSFLEIWSLWGLIL
jgi:hypothetical protein